MLKLSLIKTADLYNFRGRKSSKICSTEKMDSLSPKLMEKCENNNNIGPDLTKLEKNTLEYLCQAFYSGLLAHFYN